jgi:hypothetical protein
VRQTYNPLHDVKDQNKFGKMVEALRRGETLSPIVADGDDLLTGSHRYAAYVQAWNNWGEGEPGWQETPEPYIQILEVDEQEMLSTYLVMDASIDLWKEADTVAATLYEITEDQEIRDALRDQRAYERPNLDDVEEVLSYPNEYRESELIRLGWI